MPRNPKQPVDQISEDVTLKQPVMQGGSSVDQEVYSGGSVTTKVTANAKDEYVSSAGYSMMARLIKALPFWLGDLDRDFGIDIYERMLLDPQVSAAINVRKCGVLAKGVQIVAVKDQKSTGANGTEVEESSDQAKDIADFCQRNIDNLQGRSFESVMYEMLDAIALGHKIAEMIYDDQIEAGKLRLKAIKIKPRTSATFAVDPFFNVVGILGLIPGQGAPVIVESIIAEPGQIPNLLPRKKFCILSHRMNNGDPRGTSDLRPVYEPWFLKRVNWGEWSKYLTVFGGG